mgnify:CR=1 FL=1
MNAVETIATCPLLIDDQDVAASGGRTYDRLDPMTGAVAKALKEGLLPKT